MADKLFLDTSALYAYFDKSDSEHERISEYINLSADDFYLTNYIVDELITLLRFRNFEIKQFKSYIDEIWNESFCNIMYVMPEIEKEAWKMLIKYHDHKFSFTDCTSFVVMKKSLIKKVCTVDEHFKIAGFRVYP